MRRTSPFVTVALALLLGSLVACGPGGSQRPAVPASPRTATAASTDMPTERATVVTTDAAAPPDSTDARVVLGSWDDRRSRAWQRGDVRALRALYTSRSTAGVRDVRMLRGYLRRGLTVRGLATQRLSVTEIARDPHRLRLVVVDRLAGGWVMPDARPLPRGEARVSRVVLRRVRGEWRVASVTRGPERRAARPPRRDGRSGTPRR